MTVTAALCPLSLQTLFDRDGLPIRGGKIYAFDAQTTTPRQTFTTSALTTPNPFPVRTDAFGRIPPFFLGEGDYKVVLKDASDGSISTIDNLPGGVDDTSDQVQGTVIPTGFVMPAHTDDVEDGWLPLNAKTIGSSSSAATARADSDTQALYVKLWNKDASLTVLGGRGLSATADWNAGKTIALPDYRGRTVAGVDGMGNGLAGVLTATSTTTPDQIGTKFGVEAVTLTSAQLPAIAPVITISTAGAHVHAGSTTTGVTDGQHTHAGTTSGQSQDHTHGYNRPKNDGATGSGTPGPAYDTYDFAQSGGTSQDHTHSVNLSGGNHSHALSIVSDGSHTHTATASPIGSGQAHANAQPSILAYWHIKL